MSSSAIAHGRRTSPRHEEIASVLLNEILRGQYRAHERLPSERDLAGRFDTGRGTVREAFKKLEQLGIVSIQPGGARVVPVEHCTMDVLGPLLDLDPAPNPDLVDQVLQMFGELIGVAARSALTKATPADIERARRIVGDMLSSKEVGEREHGELRDLAELFVEVAGHLVLRLMINGLITTFWARMHASGIKPRLDGDAYREIARSLDAALEQRDASGVGEAMQRMNGVIRDSVRDALKADRRKQRKSA